MKNKWNNKTANQYIRFFKNKKIGRDLALRIYTTNIMGREPKLVLHGGGNTSLKSGNRDIYGKNIDVFYWLCKFIYMFPYSIFFQ